MVIFVDCLPLLKPFFANIDNLEISFSGAVKRVSFICTCYNVNVSWVFHNITMFFSELNISFARFHSANM